LWDVFSSGFWPKDFFTGAKWTDVLLTVFTFGLVLVGRKQASVSVLQAKIAAETREIAKISLGRPYILIDTVSHNYYEWRDGARNLTFTFNFRNYGNVPGIIRDVSAEILLSDGITEDERDVIWPATPFPDPNMVRLYMMPGREPYSRFPDALGDRQTGPGNTRVLAHDASSGSFSQNINLRYPSWHSPGSILGRNPNARPINPKLMPDPDARKCNARAWLLGTIIYENILGGVHHTNFCYRAKGDSGATEMYGKPYNERS
jgi:hypothetical protein